MYTSCACPSLCLHYIRYTSLHSLPLIHSIKQPPKLQESILTSRITGATRGIGARLALALSKAGADLILIQRDESNTTTRDTIRKAGGKADIVVCDLSDKVEVAKLIPKVTGELGRVLDVVVNCGALLRLKTHM
jgi:short-subunit dehydrogenase